MPVDRNSHSGVGTMADTGGAVSTGMSVAVSPVASRCMTLRVEVWSLMGIVLNSEDQQVGVWRHRVDMGCRIGRGVAA